MNPSDPALDLREISHAYGEVMAVSDAAIHVSEGEVVCLLGPSGCGKSTLLRVAAGLEQLQRGEVRMAGSNVAKGGGLFVPPEQRGVGLAFQDFALFPHLTVSGNVAFGLMGLDASRKSARVAEVLSQVGMQGYADTYPHALSGGQQQRVALARALAPRPRVLLLDEPFSGLDARLREQIREDTLRVLKQTGAATLMVTHDPEEAMFMADRIYLMDRGRIVQSGSPDVLYHRPVSPFVARFFTAVNEFRGRVSGGHIATPLGRLPVPGRAEGEAIQVLVRPENLRVLRPGEGGGAQAGGLMPVAGALEQVRFLGSSRLLTVRLRGGDGTATVLRVRHAGRDLPEAGGQILLHLNPGDALVFAADAQEPSRGV